MTQYELWSVLGQWAGAIATTIAVIVALRTAKLPYLKRIKVKYSSGFSVGTPINQDYLITTAINVGNRDVKISMMGLLIDKKQFFIPNTIGECQKIIKPSESVQHMMPVTNIKKTLYDYKFNKDSKVYAYVSDEEGTTYKKYIKAKVGDILRMSE